MALPEKARDTLPLGRWALIGGVISGSGLFFMRRRRKENGKRQWGGNGELDPDEEQPDLREQLMRVLDTDPDSPAEMLEAFDRSALLVRQIVESETPRTLVGLTTPELLALLRNGSRLKESLALERALLTCEAVRFRKELPTAEEHARLKSSLRVWLGKGETASEATGLGGDHV
jgi:hypothetical protein